MSTNDPHTTPPEKAQWEFQYQGEVADSPHVYRYQQWPQPRDAQTLSTNGLAIASLVLGILWLFWLGSLLAIIFGHVALRQNARRNESVASLAAAGRLIGAVGYEGGKGLAVAGLVLGYVGAGTFALFVVLPLLFGTAGA
jgi:hypothetical protein